MKNLKNNSLNILIAGILILTCSFIYGCTTKKEDNGSDTEATEKKSAPSTDIHTAALMGDVKVIRQHIEAGTDLDQKEATSGSTPLIIATVFGKEAAALALIEAGAATDITNNEGSTALHSAAFFCRPAIVKALLDKGADRNVRNVYGSTPMESVMAPFSEVKEVYDQVSKQLGPLGFKLNYAYVEKTRPEIAEMLK